MTRTASLETSKRLFELSGWDDTEYCYYANGGVVDSDTVWHRSRVSIKPGSMPAYDSDYLLGKLPKEISDKRFLHLTYPINMWVAGYATNIDGILVGKVSFDLMQTAATPA